jgi:hypothetical protein
MVMRAEEYRWSSALPHCTGRDERKLIDMDWWSERDVTMCWSEVLNQGQDDAQEIERCTFSGKPFGDTVFVQELSERFGRHWMRGRPKKNGSAQFDRTRRPGRKMQFRAYSSRNENAPDQADPFCSPLTAEAH